MDVEISVLLLEICLATIGVCVFRCADLGWRTFIFKGEKGNEKNDETRNVCLPHFARVCADVYGMR